MLSAPSPRLVPACAWELITHRPVRVGLIGTGFVAERRAAALVADDRAQLVAVAGRSPTKTAEFAARYGAQAVGAWTDLLALDLDLIGVCTVNAGRGEIVGAALAANHHVVTEYPLALDPAQAAALIEQASDRRRLLHIEHIELLGGVHCSLREHLPRLGTPLFARYSTLTPADRAPTKWTYAPSLFGFPLVGALSRLRRLTDVLGPVARVSALAKQWPALNPPEWERASWCSARLEFVGGAIAEVVYGKGEVFRSSQRRLELWGSSGTLVYEGDRGTLTDGVLQEGLNVGGRTGLFAQDMAAVLAALTTGQALYSQPWDSWHALVVADAARRSAATGQAIALEPTVTELA